MAYRSRTSGGYASLNRRSGLIALWYVFFLSALFSVSMFALNSWRMVEAKNSQSSNTDADALAAGAKLASDTLLYGDEADIYDTMSMGAGLLKDVITEAKTWSAYNYVDGKVFKLLDEDVLFGHQTLTPTRTFTTIPYATASPEELRTINAVQVVGKRTVDAARNNAVPLFGGRFIFAQVVTRSTAVLDRYVVGFENSGALMDSPLFPLALFSDPQFVLNVMTNVNEFAPQNADPNSWEKQVEGPATPPPASGAIPYGTMTVKITHPTFPVVPNGGTANAALLKIGTTTFDGMRTQMEEWVKPADFTAFKAANMNKQFLLDATTNLLAVDDYPGPAPASMDFSNLRDTLASVETAGECRVFPVFISYDVPNGKVTLTQFVAGRVSNVPTLADANANGYLSFTLTPCLISTPTALTDPTRDATFTPPRRPLENRYVCRVRMAD